MNGASHPWDVALALPLGCSSGAAAVRAVDGPRLEVIQASACSVGQLATFGTAQTENIWSTVFPTPVFPNMYDVAVDTGQFVLDEFGEDMVGGQESLPGFES